MGVLGRIRESLSRTKQQIVGRFDEIVRRADETERRSRPVDVETAHQMAIRGEECSQPSSLLSALAVSQIAIGRQEACSRTEQWVS